MTDTCTTYNITMAMRHLLFESCVRKTHQHQPSVSCILILNLTSHIPHLVLALVLVLVLACHLVSWWSMVVVSGCGPVAHLWQLVGTV